MRIRDLTAAIRARLAPAGAHHRGAAARVRPYAPTAPEPARPAAPSARRVSVPCATCGGWHAPGTTRCPLLPPTRHADHDHLYARTRIVPPWAPQAVVTTPPALPAGDGLDDVRTALEGPIRALLAQRPDLAHQASGGRELAEVTA